jgi:hypothetical protein
VSKETAAFKIPNELSVCTVDSGQPGDYAQEYHSRTRVESSPLSGQETDIFH